MPTKKKASQQSQRSKRYLTILQLRERWGNVSHMFVERRLRTDPNFPNPLRFPNGRLRLFDEEEIEAYERGAVARRSAGRRA